MSWSGGKDSSLALRRLRAEGREVAALLTTVTADFERVSMHGVRRSLIRAQASSLGLPLEEVWIQWGASNKDYDSRMGAALEKHRKMGVEEVAFGDIFLRDVREYREGRLAEAGMRGVFPLWGESTAALAREFIESGFKASVCCVDPRQLGKEFCGREFDLEFIESLPRGTDPCGERGEFHTFVRAGPVFENEIPVEVGETVIRDGFCFADIVPRVTR